MRRPIAPVPLSRGSKRAIAVFGLLSLYAGCCAQAPTTNGGWIEGRATYYGAPEAVERAYDPTSWCAALTDAAGHTTHEQLTSWLSHLPPHGCEPPIPYLTRGAGSFGILAFGACGYTNLPGVGAGETVSPQPQQAPKGWHVWLLALGGLPTAGRWEQQCQTP
ncbi:hypothetical protein HaLaN_21439 [Haematococcus lacustris]|uniref:Uncharacterized protein n=1 Tax=Haematococcus lacustris TaxID=44745 RepID=A0A699ZRK7_HAELA|nr:hypothetical protein HaLaN_21439 [Haematococcus lacustris]